jgi:hypothetical protein
MATGVAAALSSGEIGVATAWEAEARRGAPSGCWACTTQHRAKHSTPVTIRFFIAPQNRELSLPDIIYEGGGAEKAVSHIKVDFLPNRYSQSSVPIRNSDVSFW